MPVEIDERVSLKAAADAQIDEAASLIDRYRRDPLNPDLKYVLRTAESLPDLIRSAESLRLPREHARNTLLRQYNRIIDGYPPLERYSGVHKFEGEVDRGVFQEAEVPWELTDMLWGQKFFEGLPESERLRPLSVEASATWLRFHSQQEQAGVTVNFSPTPEAFGIRVHTFDHFPHRYNKWLFDEAGSYLAQMPQGASAIQDLPKVAFDYRVGKSLVGALKIMAEGEMLHRAA